MLLLHLQRHRQQRIERGFEITSGGEALLAPYHQNAAALLTHIKIHRGQELGGQLKRGHVVEDDAFRSGELPWTQRSQRGDHFDRKTLPPQCFRHGIVRVGGQQQHTRTTRDLDHRLMTIVAAVCVFGGLYDGLVMRHTSGGQTVGEANHAAAELHWHLARFELAPVAQHRERHLAICRAAQLDLDEERLAKLSAGGQFHGRNTEVGRFSLAGEPMVQFDALLRQFGRETSQRLGGVTVGNGQNARRPPTAFALRKSQRLIHRLGGARLRLIARIHFRALRAAFHHLGGIIEVKQAVLAATAFFVQLLPLRQPLRHCLLRRDGAVQQHPEVNPVRQPPPLRLRENERDQNHQHQPQRPPQ